MNEQWTISEQSLTRLTDGRTVEVGLVSEPVARRIRRPRTLLRFSAARPRKKTERETMIETMQKLADLYTDNYVDIQREEYGAGRHCWKNGHRHDFITGLDWGAHRYKICLWCDRKKMTHHVSCSWQCMMGPL